MAENGTLYAGIDPGNTGGVAFVTSSGRLDAVWDMPIKGGELDYNRLSRIFAESGPVGSAWLEMQWARPLQGLSSTSKIMRMYGQLDGWLMGRGITVRRVNPQKWKHALGLGKDKRDAVELAERLYPAGHYRGPRGGMLDGRAEAVLIAEYGRRVSVSPVRGKWSDMVDILREKAGYSVSDDDA